MNKDLEHLEMMDIVKQMGRGARKNLLRKMLFSGIEFPDFKGMAKINKITVT